MHSNPWGTPRETLAGGARKQLCLPGHPAQAAHAPIPPEAVMHNFTDGGCEYVSDSLTAVYSLVSFSLTLYE